MRGSFGLKCLKEFEREDYVSANLFIEGKTNRMVGYVPAIPRLGRPHEMWENGRAPPGALEWWLALKNK